MDKVLLEKYEHLKSYIASLGSCAVAFSSGVDSTFLLYAAKEALGEHMIALTAASTFFPGREVKEAKAFCEKLGIPHYYFETDEVSIPGFSENPENRCYLCKKELFSTFLRLAKEHGMACVVEGSNLDDDGDYRPGHIAINELGIKSPLREAGFTKEEIRIMSRNFDLPTWNKPSFACLASRFPYGEPITGEKLAMVDQGEQLLMDMGFKQFRVRIHGNVARIELLPEDFGRVMEEKIRLDIAKRFKEIGFAYTALDIIGYRTGSMNETILRGNE